MVDLNVGDVFVLQCIGDRPNYRFLEGHTNNSNLVDLSYSFMDEESSGTLWQVDKTEGNFHYFKCLNYEKGNNRFLDGNVHNSSVSLVKSTGDGFSGTRWRVTKNADGYYQFNNQGEGHYLNGHTLKSDSEFMSVDLVNDNTLSSTFWRVIKREDISLGKDTFINPIVNEGHDPWVVKDPNGSKYYYCYSGGSNIYVNTADSIQNIGKPKAKTRIIESPDRPHVWAPELHHIDGTWYVVYAASTGTGIRPNEYADMQMYIASSADPTGSFGNPFRFETEHFAIDGTFLEYGDGLYFIWSSQPDGNWNRQVLKICEVNLTPTAITKIGEAVTICDTFYDWEKPTHDPSGNPATNIEINEGPQILKAPDGTPHILYAANGSWTNDYCLGRFTFIGNSQKDLLKPACWQKHNQPVFNSGAGIAGPYGMGHVSFVNDGTSDWIVYHTARYNGAGWSRWIQTQKFTWNSTPDFGTPIPRLIPLSRS